MRTNRIANINFRVKLQEKNLLQVLADKKELRVSEYLRELISEKLKDEKLVN